ncbi:MAG TPA: hypothetical protein VGB55_07495, partial [Tepidisphaeraceae bacterium]
QTEVIDCDVTDAYFSTVWNDALTEAALICTTEADEANVLARGGGTAFDDGREAGARNCADEISALKAVPLGYVDGRPVFVGAKLEQRVRDGWVQHNAQESWRGLPIDWKNDFRWLVAPPDSMQRKVSEIKSACYRVDWSRNEPAGAMLLAAMKEEIAELRAALAARSPVAAPDAEAIRSAAQLSGGQVFDIANRYFTWNAENWRDATHGTINMTNLLAFTKAAIDAALSQPSPAVKSAEQCNYYRTPGTACNKCGQVHGVDQNAKTTGGV